jgi:hypothetical protein
MVLVAVSPVAYWVLTAIGKAVTPPVWEPPAPDARPSRWQRRHEHLHAAVATAREVLFVADPGRRSALTIRPHPPHPSAAIPAGLAAWMRTGALGTSLTVTGRTGKTYRIPLVGAHGRG